MPIRPFKYLPRNLPEWARFFQDAEVEASSGTVGTDQLQEGAVTNTRLRQSVGVSVIGRAPATTGYPADIVASLNGQVLIMSGGVLTFRAIELGDLPGSFYPAQLGHAGI